MARIRRMVADIDSPGGDTRRLREWLEVKRLAKTEAARRETDLALAKCRRPPPLTLQKSPAAFTPAGVYDD